MMDEYMTAMERLIDILPVRLLPEVGTNMSYAVPGATSADHVLALDSRVVRKGDDAVCTFGEVEAGGSHHTARIVLAAMSFDPTMRCALNLRYRPEVVEMAGDMGMSVSSFSRAGEPPGESTMEWGTRTAVEAVGGEVPDIGYDEGGVGKEPMMRVLGKDPGEVVGKVQRVVEGLAK